ncbi:MULTISPECIES: tetratricopeptide repeat protein [Methylorubrum]|uniref:tetratricopeptide repeat protein n=1 Tax=Methylorubrum TaxID=2282523 RepID=UPI0020A078AE|nr:MULTISPECIES: tetratricopeptide repeat protein [Methylorubrum]MCP1549137.1 localization factor PodJL [Methylorubrum zatmanii]MCP1554250.1 localization factor PodJL [Methylorubrum extorquens]MCP1579439.1 localization factor PodJL [Methylorubrum extorquens]
MKQTAPISLDSFDPEVLAAAREVARRAGVPLESWIASVATPDPSKPGPRRRRADAVPQAREAGAETARQVGGRATEKAPAPTPRKDGPQHKRREAAHAAEAPETTSLEASLGAMMRRLDALDRSISQEREASKADAARMIGEIEARLTTARQLAAPEMIAGRIADIERKMGEIAGQLDTPRPLGRRGRPLASEVRDAVAEVRRRQRELEEGIAEWNAASAGEPKDGPAPLSVTQAEERSGQEPSPAVAELQRETNRLRDALGGLATGRDVSELEQTMQAVASDLQRARAPQELAAIAAPVELMRLQVERIAEDVADNVHARIAGEVERLAGKVDAVLSGALSGPADQSALDAVFRELDEIRRLVASLAGPERIQSLAQGVQAISAQIAQLQRDEDAGIATLKPLLEEIRGELKAPDSSREIPGALLGRFEALAERLDGAETGSVGELIERLEGVAEKVDRVSAGGNGLDALESHVLALASRLEAPRDTDPAVARLERSMGDLLAQVTALRNGTDLEATVAHAVREAVAGSAAPPAAGGGFELLRADLAEMRASQKGADQRLQSTMEGVQTVLMRLSEQLDRTLTSSAALTAAAPQERTPVALTSAESVDQERVAHERPAAPKPAAQPSSQQSSHNLPRPNRTAPSDEVGGAEASRLSEELLEPGAGRPGPGRPATPEASPAAAGGADIKTSFIAAARRAAQAAQTEAASEAPLTARLRDKVAPARVPGAETTPLSRIRGALDGRRRTLLLGLAAVVLALGAYQAFHAGKGAPTVDPAAPEARPVASTAPAASADTTVSRTETTAEPAQAASSQAQAASATAPQIGTSAQGGAQTTPDPATTQSIAEPKAATAKRGLPQVAGMSVLGPDLTGLPPALSKLKQDALDGDGAAVWELASREAEGRGVTRDLAIAAKLYERLANAGYAPAQFKVGNAYEKGSGVVRDIERAKGWYGRAADQGNIRAMHNLAVMHAENPAANGKADFVTAANAFRRAAEHGVRDSQYNLAVLYARGLGVGQDLVQSYLWFSAAAIQGDQEAGRKRDEVAAKLSPKDLAEAKSLASGFKAKPVDPAANESPSQKATAAAGMSLMGAPSPGMPTAASQSAQKRFGV